MTKLPKSLEQKIEQMADQIGTDFTKLVNSYGSVEKNLDFNAARWGAVQGFTAGALEVMQMADKLVEALKHYANHESVIKEAYHSNDERQITCVHTFINQAALDALSDWQAWKDRK